MATTGIATSGTDFIGATGALKEVYDKPFENNIEGESEVWSALEKTDGFEKTNEDGDGKGIKIDHNFSYGGGIYAMNESDYFGSSSLPTTVQSSTLIPTYSATVQMSGKLMRRMKSDKVAFTNWADVLLPKRAKRLAFHLDRSAIGTGTGIIGRISGSPTGTNDILFASYGISGLEGAGNLILRGDVLRYSPNADGSSPRAGAATVVQKPNGVTGVFSVDTLPTSAAANDYVALGDANVNNFGKELMGLEGIIDDGTNLTTIQTLSRTTYAELKAQIIDSTAGQYGGVLSEELIDFADSQAFEQGDGGQPNLLLVNRSGNRSFWKALKADRSFMNPGANYTAGRAKLEMLIGDRMVKIVPARKVPISRAYGIDTRAIKRADIGPGGWVDTTGAVFKQVSDGTGYKDAYVAHYIKETQIITYDPAMCYKITGLGQA
jgi:hypothetical protein